MVLDLFRERTVKSDNSKTTQKRPPRRKFLSFLRGAKLQPSAASKGAREVLGGRYLSPKGSIDSSGSEHTEKTLSWKSCDSPDYKRDPLNSFEKNCEIWDKAIQDARRLPQSTLFSNNHIMVNTERAKRCAPALKRMSDLDALARWHAEKMASENSVFHADETELLSRLERSTDFLGENVARGESIQSIHKEMMKNKADVYNMADRRYTEMGMATCRADDGEIFLCQLFRR